jgi:hypothetical protein
MSLKLELFYFKNRPFKGESFVFLLSLLTSFLSRRLTLRLIYTSDFRVRFPISIKTHWNEKSETAAFSVAEACF